MSATKSAVWEMLEQQEQQYTPSDEPELPKQGEPQPATDINELPF